MQMNKLSQIIKLCYKSINIYIVSALPRLIISQVFNHSSDEFPWNRIFSLKVAWLDNENQSLFMLK